MPGASAGGMLGPRTRSPPGGRCRRGPGAARSAIHPVADRAGGARPATQRVQAVRWSSARAAARSGFAPVPRVSRLAGCRLRDGCTADGDLPGYLAERNRVLAGTVPAPRHGGAPTGSGRCRRGYTAGRQQCGGARCGAKGSFPEAKLGAPERGQGQEMTAWRRAAALVDGRVYGGGAPCAL